MVSLVPQVPRLALCDIGAGIHPRLTVALGGHCGGGSVAASGEQEQEQTNDSELHLMPRVLAASRMITSKAAEEVSPRDRAIFASNDLATSVMRKVVGILMYSYCTYTGLVSQGEVT